MNKVERSHSKDTSLQELRIKLCFKEEIEELSEEERQELTGKEYGKLTEEEKHMKEEYEQLMEKD